VSGAIRIRLWGLKSECETAARRIAAVLPVVSVSELRADRGQSSLVRVYIEARLPDDTGPHHTAAHRELKTGRDIEAGG
jgi:hypothetical protein